MNEMRWWGGWLALLGGAGVSFYSLSLGNWSGLGVGIMLVLAGVWLLMRAVRMEAERQELVMVGKKRRKLPRKKPSGLAEMTDRELRLLAAWERVRNPSPNPSPQSPIVERGEVMEVEDEMEW